MKISSLKRSVKYFSSLVNSFNANRLSSLYGRDGKMCFASARGRSSIQLRESIRTEAVGNKGGRI